MGLLVCGLDFETSGLDPERDRIIEVGAVLFDWEKQVPVTMLTAFMAVDVNITEEINEHTGITNEMLEDYGRDEREVWEDLNYLLSLAQHTFAHFGKDFDQKFFNATCERLGLKGLDPEWIDTSIDVPYPEHITTRKLMHLAAEHGFLNPFSHRAVFDVLTMLMIAGRYPFERILSRAREPILYVQACVSFDEKELAKARGYRWAPASKIWWKAMKSSDYSRERMECGFLTRELAEQPSE